MGNFIVSGAAVAKAGANVSSDITDAQWTTWISGAENFINVHSRYNWSDDYSTLNDDVKNVLADVASSLVAINAITYDMSGYTSRSEAQTMLDVNKDIANQGLKELDDENKRKFIQAA